MGYGRLGSTESLRSIPDPNSQPAKTSKKRKLLLLALVAFVFLLASGISAAVLVRIRANGSGSSPVLSKAPTRAISKTCGKTRYPSLCVNSLVDFPGALEAGEKDLVHISVNMTLQRVGRALYGASSFTNTEMDGLTRAAYEDCLELLEDSVDQLGQSLSSVAPPIGGGSRRGSADDVLTWLSAALTNQDTCDEGLADVKGAVKDQMAAQLKDLMEIVSNCLAIFAGSSDGGDFAGVPIQNRRRRLMGEEGGFPVGKDGFPTWMTARDRRLLQVSAAAIQPDIVVSKDGNGTYKTITEAIKAAPQESDRRTIIYVKAGR